MPDLQSIMETVAAPFDVVVTSVGVLGPVIDVAGAVATSVVVTYKLSVAVSNLADALRGRSAALTSFGDQVGLIRDVLCMLQKPPMRLPDQAAAIITHIHTVLATAQGRLEKYVDRKMASRLVKCFKEQVWRCAVAAVFSSCRQSPCCWINTV